MLRSWRSRGVGPILPSLAWLCHSSGHPHCSGSAPGTAQSGHKAGKDTFSILCRSLDALCLDQVSHEQRDRPRASPAPPGMLPRRLFPEIPAPAESPIPTPNPPSPSSPAVASLAGGGPMCHGDRDLGMAREPHEMLSALQLWPHSPALSWTNSCGRRGFSKGRTMGLDAATCFACSRG